MKRPEEVQEAYAKHLAKFSKTSLQAPLKKPLAKTDFTQYGVVQNAWDYYDCRVAVTSPMEGSEYYSALRHEFVNQSSAEACALNMAIVDVLLAMIDYTDGKDQFHAYDRGEFKPWLKHLKKMLKTAKKENIPVYVKLPKALRELL